MNYYEYIILNWRITVELSDLLVFQSVAQAGGVTRAAARLHRVPSNVTTRVRQLEQALGVRLFAREKRQMSLTAQGEVLLDYAERILALARQAEEALHGTRPMGRLRLGTMESTAATRLPVPLSEYNGRYPQVAIELRMGPTRELLAAVAAGALDAALVADKVADPRLAFIALYEEELVLVAERKQGRVRSSASIANLCALTFASGCSYRQRLEGWLAQAGIAPRQIIELSSYHAILGCVVAGMGVALVPRSLLSIYPSRSQLSVHKLPRHVALSRTYLAWRESARSPKLDALAQVLQSHVPARRKPAA